MYLNVFLKTYFCFLERLIFGGSLAGSLNKLTKIGPYFLNITLDTAKFLSNKSIFCLNSTFKFDMSAHFWDLLKNSIRLTLLLRKSLVRETPFPWTVVEAWPTVGRVEFRQATHKAQANQWIWLPSKVYFKKKKIHWIKNIFLT